MHKYQLTEIVTVIRLTLLADDFKYAQLFSLFLLIFSNFQILTYFSIPDAQYHNLIFKN